MRRELSIPALTNYSYINKEDREIPRQHLGCVIKQILFSPLRQVLIKIHGESPQNWKLLLMLEIIKLDLLIPYLSCFQIGEKNWFLNSGITPDMHV